LQLQQHKAEIDSLDLRVAAITFESPIYAESYITQTGFPWPLLIDGSRSLYRAYSMERGSLWAVWGPQNWGAYFKLMARGRMPRLPHDDVHQLGGDVLIAPDGKVCLHHVGRGPADRPSIDSLLSVVRSHVE
jgi:hypothetical protein